MKIEVKEIVDVEVNNESDGGFSCYIPKYKIYFSAKDTEDVAKKVNALVKSQHNFFIGMEKDGKIQYIK